MRTMLFNSAVIVGVVWMGTAPADAAPPSMPGIGNTSIRVATGERVGYRRYYRRYGYPVPYAYYPPPYGYYVPPPAYAYPPPDIDYAGSLLLRTAPTATLHRTATTPTLHRTAIMATLRLPMVTTPTLRRTAIIATVRPRKVTNRRQESVLAEDITETFHKAIAAERRAFALKRAAGKNEPSGDQKVQRRHSGARCGEGRSRKIAQASVTDRRLPQAEGRSRLR